VKEEEADKRHAIRHIIKQKENINETKHFNHVTHFNGNSNLTGGC
jgi:hypothetical protein